MSRVNFINRILNNKNGYTIFLANGQDWYITATKKIRPWLDKLASILELEPSEPNGHPRMIFIPKKSNKEVIGPVLKFRNDILKGLPAGGWFSYNLKTLQFWFHPDIPDVICEMTPTKNYTLDIIKMWQSLYPIYQQVQGSGGLPFHAALVEREGMGILLAGPGEAGKTTCCQRLPHPWHTQSDDEALIVKDEPRGYLVHPFPTWSELLRNRSPQTWNVQKALPLAAIFFLEQRKIDQVIPLGQAESSVHSYKSSMDVCQRSWRNLGQEEERMLKKKLFNNACELARAVPAFKLRVSLKGQFWEEIEKVLYCLPKRELFQSENELFIKEIKLESAGLPRPFLHKIKAVKKQ